MGIEAIYAAIVIPSDRVVLRVIFPPNYKIENKQFKVTIIDSTIKDPDEISTVKKVVSINLDLEDVMVVYI